MEKVGVCFREENVGRFGQVSVCFGELLVVEKCAARKKIDRQEKKWVNNL